jgi:hypothetical protein
VTKLACWDSKLWASHSGALLRVNIVQTPSIDALVSRGEVRFANRDTSGTLHATSRWKDMGGWGGASGRVSPNRRRPVHSGRVRNQLSCLMSASRCRVLFRGVAPEDVAKRLSWGLGNAD